MRAAAERWRRQATPRRLVELFVFSNLAFLAVDVYLAHSENDFASPLEWVPVALSAAAPLWLATAWALEGRGHLRAGGLAGGALGAASLAVGIAGLLFHLQSGFFGERTLRSLVYAAPFLAPLSYGGLGLLLLLDRMLPSSGSEWTRWVLFLAFGGFAGNLGLGLLDHAQNGFFDPREWIAVVAAAFGVAFLLLAVLRPRDAVLRRASVYVMWSEALVGMIGFALHLDAITRGPMETFWQNAVYAAPLFAPLLFTDLALLALLGLWAAGRTGPTGPEPAESSLSAHA